ncbi:MAG: hypothetical protein LC667_10285 [Thioalkalivibrio sp.]|nr:hypothetical protein [Thioalkalivibrio sp.]
MSRPPSPVRTPLAFSPTRQDLDSFRSLVLTHFRVYGRDFLWRRTRNPYFIVVSEIMLQQTQVTRVEPKYAEFIEAFPDLEGLARAPLEEVLRRWQGLGYNRRAVALKRLADQVIAEHGGCIPRDLPSLRALPGVGPATAAAVAAFAFGDAHPFLETNIRAAYLHHFFPDRDGVGDAELLPLVEATLDRADPRTWYYSLMDYGSALKREGNNPSRRSRHHSRQSPFEGSKRQLRSRALRAILDSPGIGAPDLAAAVDMGVEDLEPVLAELVREGFAEVREGLYRPAL